jgi:hypothetical protein
MFGRPHLFQDILYFAIGANEVGGSLGTHIFFAIQAFLGPHMVRFHKFPIRVAQQRKWQAMFFDEFLVTFNAIGADPEKFRFRLKFTP